MTTLKIIPDFENKTAECIGYPSAGEHVDVRIVGAANLLPSPTLRFRVKFGHVTLALFPRSDVNEAWETEGSDLKCHLNLNTVQARSVCRMGNTVCHAILDQVGDDEHTVEPTLFFDDLFDVTPWCRESGADEPYDLDRYPNQIADLNQRVNEIGGKIAEAKAAAQAAQGSANAAYESAHAAVSAAQSANARANAAESAARGASADASRARNDADRAEAQVSSAAESASASAASAASAAQSAAEAVAGLANKADLVGGKVPASQLPSYVDDVLEFDSASEFPATGESGKIYIAKDTNKQYRWSGTQYVELGGGGAGEDTNAVHYYPETKTDAQKAQVRQNIGAMAADTPIPDVAGKLPLRPLPKYLHYLAFDDTYIEDARAWYESHSNDSLGGCSAVRKGGLLGRNYDWNYDEMSEFVVKVSSKDGRHASVGVANVRTELTEEIVCSGVFSPLCRVLPGRTVDGINDAGVVAEVNVIPRDETKDPAKSATRNLHAFEVVRHVLDNYDNAQDAAEYVAAHYYIPSGDYSYHWMIADANGTYIVEDGAVIETETTMTNYRVGVADDPYGNGYARRTILGGSGTVAELLSAVKFTNAYASGWPWPDEFASADAGITHGETDALKAWADTYVTPLIDPATRKPKARGNGCWQTCHSCIYDFAAKTMAICVQEDFTKRYVFSVGGANVTLDDTVTQSSANGVKSSGIWSWVKGLLPSWLTPTREEPPTQASVAAKYTKPSGGIPATDMTQAVQGSLALVPTAAKQSAWDAKADQSDIPELAAPSATATDAQAAKAKATYDFVNSSVNAMAAFFLAKDDGTSFATRAELAACTSFLRNGLTGQKPTQNDYTIVVNDETNPIYQAGVFAVYSKWTATDDYIGYWVDFGGAKTLVTSANKDSLGIVVGGNSPTVPYTRIIPTSRYSYQGEWETEGSNGWRFQYSINTSGFTAAQLAALNSGASAELFAQIAAALATIPTEYLKNATATDNSITVTKQDNTQVSLTVNYEYAVGAFGSSIASGEIRTIAPITSTVPVTLNLGNSATESADCALWVDTSGLAADVTLSLSSNYNYFGDTGYQTMTKGKYILVTFLRVNATDVIVTKKEY